jgi:hypothetical protein
LNRKKNQSVGLRIYLGAILPFLPQLRWCLVGVGGAPLKRVVGCKVSNSSCKKRLMERRRKFTGHLQLSLRARPCCKLQAADCGCVWRWCVAALGARQQARECWTASGDWRTYVCEWDGGSELRPVCGRCECAVCRGRRPRALARCAAASCGLLNQGFEMCGMK